MTTRAGDASGLSQSTAHDLGASTEEGRAFFQKRVHDLARVFLLLVTVMTALSAAGRYFIPSIRTRNDVLVTALMASSVVLVGSLWWLTRPVRARSARALAWLDAGCTVDTSVLIAFMTYAGRDQPVAGIGALMAVMLMVIGRALFVPSSRRRTVLVSLATALPVVGAHAVIALAHPDTLLVPPSVQIVLACAWSAAAVLVASIGSGIIYGLRQEVQDAKQLGQYTLLEQIGEGGMGVVYRARHAMLRRPTAVKLLQPARSGGEELERFEREVQLTAELTHPNTIAIFDYGRSPDGVFYYAMEYLDGIDLGRLVERFGPQPAGRAIAILVQICGALAEAHERGLVHRDIKPANVMLCVRGGIPDFAKVLDFGLVKPLDTKTDLTGFNRIAGTPGYLPPEAMTTPDDVGPAGDLYALGCVGYFLVTGRPVFEGATAAEVCAAHLHVPPPRPSDVRGEAVGEGFEALLLRCLAKRPADRPASARELEIELRRLPERAGWTAEACDAWWREARAAGAVAGPRQPSSASAVGFLSTMLFEASSPKTARQPASDRRARTPPRDDHPSVAPDA